MAQDQVSLTVALLSRALHRIRTTPPRVIASPPTQQRRASVAIIIRVVPPSSTPIAPSTSTPSLSEFFQLDWVKHPDARPEILFLQRDSTTPEHAEEARVKRNEAHVAFPGGRTEAEDEGGMYTALRQTWEEIGIDLADRDYTCIGQLDDREITTSLGKRLLMILSPYVFLQLTPHATAPDPPPSTVLYWTPLSAFVSLHGPPKWSSVTVDAASRIAPKHSTALRVLVRLLVGSMEFPAIVLSSSPPTPPIYSSEKEEGAPPHRSPKLLKLWGLSLGMTLDLMSYMIHPDPNELRVVNGYDSDEKSRPQSPFEMSQLPHQTSADPERMRMELVAPSLASVFPRFSYPDVNFWIWVFGKRYREVVRGWEASIRSGGANDRRINWSGSALNTFYAAIRKALVLVIVARALGIVFGLGFAGWWIFST